MKSTRWFVSYIAVAFVGLGLAFALSLRFMAPAHSQDSKLEAPGAGDLPPEFLNEVNKTQVPPPTTAAKGATSPTSSSTSKAQVPNATPNAGVNPTTIAPAPKNSGPVVVIPPSVENVGADEATAPAPAPVPGGDGYVYDPTGRRDPFAAFHVITQNRGGEKQAVIDPLQKWELERLKVIGILWEVHSPRAMLKDPDGHVYTIVKNTKVGRNNGYVSAIREGEVVVVETFEVEGTTNKETKVLELGK